MKLGEADGAVCIRHKGCDMEILEAIVMSGMKVDFPCPVLC